MGTKTNTKRTQTKVHVTQQDIDLGIGVDCRLCPVALALQRTFGVLKKLDGTLVEHIVYSDSIALCEVGGSPYRYEQPVAWQTTTTVTGEVTSPFRVKQFIRRFDKRQTRGLAEPFTFLWPPSGYDLLGNRLSDDQENELKVDRPEEVRL